ncbi:MAG: glutaminyl-peptide cyclotransferase [Firmicutes bacterium]|nr:glutaminyl-peptide cyclotransferase [Bacillota bacterium]
MVRFLHHSILWFLVVLVLGQPVLAASSYSFGIVNSYPHDSRAFTQGLVFHEGYLYEGTGLYGKSSLRQVHLDDGAVLQSVALSEEFFGEGITILGQRIFQLTWRERQGFVYDLDDLTAVGTFSLDSEGWGLTSDGQYLILSDGSHVLTYLDPETFETVRKVQVYFDGRPLSLLNELEYVGKEIFANVWFSNIVYRIDPGNGEVLGWIDLTDLYTLEQEKNPGLDVLNGIAYDPVEDRLFVTGKLWSNIYEIRISEEVPLPAW